MPQLQWRGRWRHTRVLPIYIHELQAVQAARWLPVTAAQKVGESASLLCEVLGDPFEVGRVGLCAAAQLRPFAQSAVPLVGGPEPSTGSD